MRKYLFILLFLGGFFPLLSQTNPVIQEVKDSSWVRLQLHFYPSTLRMLNFQRDTAIDEMVKNIKKMSFYILRSENFNHNQYYDAVEQLNQLTGYEPYLVWEDTRLQMELIGNPDEEKLTGVARYEDQYYLMEMEGTLDLRQFPAIYESISNPDSTQQNGFSYIFDMIDDRLQPQRRNRNREQPVETPDSTAVDKN